MHHNQGDIVRYYDVKGYLYDVTANKRMLRVMSQLTGCYEDVTMRDTMRDKLQHNSSLNDVIENKSACLKSQ